MSLITDMVVMCAIAEGDAMLRVNRWCAENDRRYDDGQQFAGLIRPAFTAVDTENAGGAKVFCSQVWAMAGNYFPVGELVKAWPRFGWRCPAGVVLMVSSELDDEVVVRVYRADGKHLDSVAPAGW